MSQWQSFGADSVSRCVLVLSECLFSLQFIYLIISLCETLVQKCMQMQCFYPEPTVYCHPSREKPLSLLHK